MCFRRNGTSERAVSATGQLCFMQKLQMDIWCWPLHHTLSYHQASRHAHSQIMLYYADLLKVNLITFVIPDQRVFLPMKNPSWRKKTEEKNMTSNQKGILWRWHRRQADPSEGWQTVDVLPRVVPGVVPGSPRLILRARAPRLCPCHKDREVIRTNCTKSHTSSHLLSWPTKQVDAESVADAQQQLEESTGLLQVIHILLFQLMQWCMMLLWHFSCFWKRPGVNKALHRVNDSS